MTKTKSRKQDRTRTVASGKRSNQSSKSNQRTQKIAASATTKRQPQARTKSNKKTQPIKGETLNPQSSFAKSDANNSGKLKVAKIQKSGGSSRIGSSFAIFGRNSGVKNTTRSSPLRLIMFVVFVVIILIFLYAVVFRRFQNSEVAVDPTPIDTAAVVATAEKYDEQESLMPDSPQERNGMYAEVPPMTIDPNKVYLATFDTEKGEVVIELFADKAPHTVNNFVFLARQGFYNNTTFHRVLKDFMAQGGDPTGLGSGGPGYEFDDEFHPDLKHDSAGILSMANAGANTNGSQFFITFAPTPWLDGYHSVFGKVVKGMDVLLSITLRDPQTATEPGDAIHSIEISESDVSLLPTPTPIIYVNPGEIKVPEEPAARNGLYAGRTPAMVIDPDRSYSAIIETEHGDITIELYADLVPNTVNNFVFLAQEGYYDNTTFHRVIENFMAQAGDPTGIGSGGPGYTFADEINPKLRHDDAGILSMANAGTNTNGSQFFITFDAAPWLDGLHTIFGKVISGYDVLDKIHLRDPATATEPGDVIKTIRIIVE